MKFFQLNDHDAVGKDRQPQELDRGSKVLTHRTNGHGIYDFEVKVPYTVHADSVTIHLAQIEGPKERVKFDIPLVQGTISPCSAEDLYQLGVKSLTLEPTKAEHHLFYIRASEGPSVEWWSNAESAQKGREIPEGGIRREIGW